MQLIVLGMHRSGTSVLARLLNLMGAYFGPEGISTGAMDENPKGFWERRDVRKLNDWVLHQAGCDWNRVHRFELSRLDDAVLEEFQDRAAQLVLEMDAHRPWLVKEPRLCLLFPLWRRVLEVPVCIHIFRHPVEVASSLLKRNGIPMDVGLALWEAYVSHGLRAASGLPALGVSHRRLMQDPVQEVGQLLDGLKAAGVSGLRMPAEREIAAFVRQGLYRERDTRQDLGEHTDALLQDAGLSDQEIAALRESSVI
ncbi:MAG: sulfotransferase [Proteobacteria bacterium]|nr:sulfotransferase [Pseudomonadota bacterium]